MTVYALFFLAVSVLLSCSLAQTSSSYVRLQGNSSGPAAGYETLNAADKAPNASHAVAFQLSPDRDWTWTLQISDVALPNISTTIQEAHVAYTTWHLSSTANASSDLDNLSSSSSESTCIYLIDAHFPSNVSTSWNDASSSCASAIGSQCESAILSHTRSSDDCFSGNFNGLGSEFDDACGTMFGDQGLSTQGYRLSNDDLKNSTYAWALSDPYQAGNSTAFETAEGRLRLFVLTSSEGKGVFCNRVSAGSGDANGTQSPNSDGAAPSGTSSSGAAGPTGSSGGASGANSASSFSSPSGMMGLFAVLTVITVLFA